MSEHSQEQREEIARVWFGHPNQRPDILPNTRYYVLDTCVLLYHITLIIRIIRSAFANNVAIQFIVPAMVKLELEKQASTISKSGNRFECIKSYEYWFHHDNFCLECRRLSDQAVYVLDQLNRLVLERVPTFRYQHRDEITAMKALVADDYILDCSIFFLHNFSQPNMVCLISNDTDLCRKAAAFNCPRLHHDEYHRWIPVLDYCQIPHFDWLNLEDLPKPYPRRWNRSSARFSSAELLKREMRHLTYMHFEDVVDVDNLQNINLKSKYQIFNDYLFEEVKMRELNSQQKQITPIKWLE